MLHDLTPGSYIFPNREPVLEASSFKLQVSRNRLHTHPDFYLVKSEGSIGIDAIREVGHFLRIKPVVSPHKILIIENFHLATIEAQNAFLKTFEEPPEYAYIFLVTPYVDRLLKTIVSRAQVMEGFKTLPSQHSPFGRKHDLRFKNLELKTKNYKLQTILQMSIGERFLWLENEIKNLEDKIQIKLKLLEIIDAFLTEGVELLQEEKVSIEAIEYLKDARWKIEQGFPNPKLLVEGFFVKLE